MNHINLIKNIDLAGSQISEKDKDVSELFNGPFRRLMEVRLRNGATLSKHKAVEPITVLCLSGTGIFTAGADLEESQQIQAGTLITLEGGIEHEVTALPALHLIVTKFKNI
jgi:quercetin dioxygenase-like cupin family protein